MVVQQLVRHVALAVVASATTHPLCRGVRRTCGEGPLTLLPHIQHQAAATPLSTVDEH